MGQHGEHGSLVKATAIVAVTLAASLPVPAVACRLALLLALDVSSSVDPAEYELQRSGLAAALLAPEVESAFLNGVPVALAAYEWSGRYNQATVLDWRLIAGRADLLAASERIATTRRSETEHPTAIGYALGHAASFFSHAPVCERRTIDISGDGENNEGFAPVLAYRHFPLGGVTVNALAIGGSVQLDGLVDYFRAEVIRGPGAFVQTALDYGDFERAMRLKLEREIAVRILGAAE
ncbi:MAG: DUF1194 domain-containing protein [Rhodobacteraceae bacterium]|nr:MAG: DUF1194 domain-containing protein [Paracoccaceae bacterium]